MTRWVFLLFSSLAFLLAEVFVEQSAPLVSRLCGTAEACRDGSDPSCLSFTSTEFNSIYVVHFWAGGLAALSAGFIVGRYGIWLVSCVTAILLFIGLLLVTVAPYLPTSTAAFWMTLCGRLFFSAGYFAQIVLSHQVKSHWFYGRELALAFTIYVVSGPIGSIIAMATAGYMAQQYGLQMTLWIVFAISIWAPICAILAGWIYLKYASESIDAHVYSNKGARGDYGFGKLMLLGKEFWIIAGMVFFSFGSFVTALYDYPKFLTDAYGYSEAAAGLITGIIADLAIFTPIFGHLIDKYGRRDIINLIGTTLFFIGFFILVIIPGIHALLPVVCCIIIAIAYTHLSAGIWASVPVVTSPAIVGIAMSVSIAMQAVGSGLMLLVTGLMLDQASLTILNRWENFFILVTSLAGISLVLSGISMYYDWKDPLRPLRAKHMVAAVTAEGGNPYVEPEYGQTDVNEVSPLIGSHDKDLEYRKHSSSSE